MSEISDHYRKLATLLTEKVAAVPSDGWDAPTPCGEWTARQLVGHVSDSTGMFMSIVERTGPDLPSIDDSPLATWEASRDFMQAALDDPEVAGLEHDGVFGRSTFERSVDRFICADLLVHNWDLSRATGQDEHLDPQEVHHLFEAMRPMDEAICRPGAFGPKVEPPADADEQTQLLCFLGRTV